MKRQVVTEETVRRAHRDKQPLPVSEGAIITPAARDAIKHLSVTLQVAGEPTRNVPAVPRFRLIGFGFCPAQKDISAWVEELFDVLGIEYRNHGKSHGADIYAQTAQICRQIQDGAYWRGIILDSNGIAASVLANKFTGIRSAVISDPHMALIGRQTTDLNLLVLAGDHLGRKSISQIAKNFLETEYDGEKHHHKLERISEIEEGKGQ